LNLIKNQILDIASDVATSFEGSRASFDDLKKQAENL